MRFFMMIIRLSPEPPMTKVTEFLLHRILHTKICLTNSPQAIPIVPTVLT
ncbi:TPA: hypothetical protein ACMUZ3_000525 [Clostridioides difficile]|nr:hypothetical protein [Clostridioides difficile]MCI9961774.1 hypothetical protein [Clostridioides difficile]HBE9015099.1 hypothetical protein [Clostridioides difficile]HBE9322817.1 hypothetical protein [Clostridioides difficile]HBG1254085.1 hypothetical protein [Clostridioides difficile]